MGWLFHYSLLAVLPTVIFLHLLCSPYTKVEESFNIQAIHDILTYSIPFSHSKERLLKNYDHFTFPGVVPRTFVGALAAAGVSQPWIRWLPTPADAQVLVRGIVGLGNAVALLFFQDAVSQSFGRVAGYWFVFFQASQFHIMYYASRTLPNMFAFGISTVALRYLMLSNFGPRPRRAARNRLALYLLTMAGIIFRSEIAILLGMQVAWLVLVRRVSLRRVIIPAGITAMTIGLVATVSIDSFFWQQFPLWPEWVAFRYNTVEGKSADWGTSPWHFYFSNAIPRLMMNPMALFICIPVALADRLTRRFSLDVLTPLLAFVAVYSILPHKEWRFIIYIIPALTGIASAGAAWIWNRRRKSFACRFLSLALLASTVATFAANVGLLAISSLNYPGAHALNRLHEIAHEERPLIRVHLDDLSCQSGVTRFLQKPAPALRPHWETETVWHYDKSEDAAQLQTPEFWARFDYALDERPERVLGNWEVIEEIEGFAGVAVTKGDSAEARAQFWRRVMRHGVRPATYLGRLRVLWWRFEAWMKEHVTGGRFVVVKMEPKIRIMRKVDN